MRIYVGEMKSEGGDEGRRGEPTHASHAFMDLSIMEVT